MNWLIWATHQIYRCARMCCVMGVVLLNINCKFSNKTFRYEFICICSFLKHSGNDKFITHEQWGIYGWKWPQENNPEIKALSLKSQCTALKERTIMNNDFGRMWKEAVMAYKKIPSNSTCQKVAGSIPNSVIGIFHWHNPSSHTMALGSTQRLTDMSTRSTSWGSKGSQWVGLTTFPPSCNNCLEFLGASTFWNPQVLSRDYFTFYFPWI
jgi:hypothetical protein